MSKTSLITATAAGAAGAFGARALLMRGLLAKFRRDLAKLNAGEYEPLLSAYADDAVLMFNDGDHRWAGEHRGKPAIERFLQEFVNAGVKGELTDAWIGGPPWALTFVARFDDGVTAPDGEELYRNRVVLIVRTRWGKIVRHDDFYEDTGRIERLEEGLNRLGIAPLDRTAVPSPT